MNVAEVIEVAPIETRVGAPDTAEWRALNTRARAGNMFLSPDWLEPWWAQFGAGREQQILCVREGGKLIGVLPLFAEAVRLGGVDVRRVAFLGDGETGCDYLDAIAEPGREREVLEHCLEALMKLPWDLCDLDGVWRESFTAGQLPRASPRGAARSCATRGCATSARTSR